ncbi:MAG TPA: VWA domain-containing protein [Chloroflexota bacterium]|nr:VWA domain-containing protein [Chloroflexota bacterium]
MSSQTTEPDPYAILGVAPDTPFKEVRAAHRRLILELHPDINPAARERFDAVQKAFESLREQHDRARGRGARQDTRHMDDEGPSGTDVLVPGGQRRPDPNPAAPPVRNRAARTAEPDFISQTATIVAPAPASAPEIAQPGGPPLQVVLTPGRESLLLQPRAQMLYVLLDLKLSQETRSNTQPLNLSLVLDHSSSMQRDDKLQRLKEAVSRIIDMMEPHDYLSIVTFGDRATVLLASSPLGDKRAAKEALDAIRCRGGTEISTGIRAGLQELQTHTANLLSQMLVLTDGQTYGDEAICLALATQAGERQVQITALGLGDDWNSALLDELALRTNGHSDYVQSAEQLTRVFEEQLRTLQLTAIRNLTLTVNTAISSRLLRATWVAPSIKLLAVPADAAPGAQAIELELGRVSTDRDYRLLLELVVAARTPGKLDVAEVTFGYEVPGLGRDRESTSLKLSTTFVDKWEKEPPVHHRVHDALRKITAHRLQEQAMQAIQEGQTQKGTASLRTAANHLEAAGSPDLAALARAEADRIERQGQAQAGNMKRIIYGTRGLG